MKNSNNPFSGDSSSRFGFEIIFKEDEKYYLQFNDTAGEPLLFGKGYSSEKSCSDGIQAIIRAAGSDEQYDLQETKKGKYFFILKSGNHKEIGRSRTFDRLEELEVQMELLKSINESVPQYGLVDDTPEIETQVEVPEEKAARSPMESKEKIPEENSKTVESPAVVETKPAQPEEAEKMPRYKFSIIYYPDSQVWMLKNDFSDESIKLKTCDGQQIETFLKSQLPPEQQATPPAPAKPEAPAKPAAAPQALKPALEELELILRNNQGKQIDGFAKIGSIGKVELSPKIAAGDQDQTFDAKVMAKSLSDNQTVLIGVAYKQNLVDGRLEIPVYGSNSLKQGLYRFTVDINQTEPHGSAASSLEASWSC
ncbi:MAG: DUF1508 domain-containing protein [Lewinellaceae bacterium]|nr:DUF1508 domain-containing protein [Lewinellaceae bacterium]